MGRDQPTTLEFFTYEESTKNSIFPVILISINFPNFFSKTGFRWVALVVPELALSIRMNSNSDIPLPSNCWD